MEAKFLSIITGVTRPNTPKPPQPVQNTDAAASAQVVKTVSVRHVDTTQATGTTDESAAAHKQATEKTLDELVSDLNKQIQSTTRALHFTVDEKYGRPIVSVVDKETNEVVRQIPTEVALQLADALDDVTGVLVSDTA